jgi:hypothetical protein
MRLGGWWAVLTVFLLSCVGMYHGAITT